MGANYKGFFFSMNWTGAAERSLVLSEEFCKPFNIEGRGLMIHQIDGCWTPETAATAKLPRLSVNSATHNYKQSTLTVKNGNYLKLKNLTFGYNFTGYPALKKLGIQQLGLKFTAYNLLILTSLTSWTPNRTPTNITTPIRW